MSLKEIPLFSALTDRMKWLSARQKVLTQNIANSDTPGYEAKDLKAQSFKQMVARTSEPSMDMQTTSDKHIITTEKSEFRPKTDAEPYEVTPQGNAVVLEEQMMKLSETQIEYQMTTSLYKKQIGMLKTALGRGR
ncbi:MAG: flagellar basal body rod protein FlgB [Sneathiella sp.]|nr:flagellar basal body rod protein FlgB [Sneathiella sp.]